MATKQEIEVLITPEGEVKLEVKGIKGHACLPIVKKLADLLGLLKSQDLTSEYYEQSPQTKVEKRAGS
jgi:hypothetical protein